MTIAAPVDRVVHGLERLDCRPRRHGQGVTARCPAHEDRSPSLTVSTGRDGRALVYCFAGCHVDAILAALGLELRDLFEPIDGDELRAVPPRRLRAAPTLDELAADHPSWAAWRTLGGTFADAPRLRQDATDEARSWITARAREAWRTCDIDTLGRLLAALGVDWPDGHHGQWLAITVETSVRDAWWTNDRDALARAVDALNELDAVAA